jgi:hypothetical protein
MPSAPQALPKAMSKRSSPDLSSRLNATQMTAAIENGDGQRSALELAPFAQCDINDGGSLGKIYH